MLVVDGVEEEDEVKVVAIKLMELDVGDAPLGSLRTALHNALAPNIHAGEV